MSMNSDPADSGKNETQSVNSCDKYKGYAQFLQLYENGKIKEGTILFIDGLTPSGFPMLPYQVFNKDELYIVDNLDVPADPRDLLERYCWGIAEHLS